MFGTIGGPELFLIMVIALIVFGPKKLPEIGRSLGRMMVEFRKATTDFQQTVEREIEADKIRTLVESPGKTEDAPGSGEAPAPAPAVEAKPAEAVEATVSRGEAPPVAHTDPK